MSIDTTTLITNDGCKIHYRYYSKLNKPTVILSNSLGTTMAMWEPQLAILKEHFSVLLYDMRGHGLSTVMPGGYSLDRLGSDVVELLDHLELEKVYFCGLSIGGMLGQWLSVVHPQRLHSLVLANTSAYAGPADFWRERLNGIEDEGLQSTWPMVRQRWVSDSFSERNPNRVAMLKKMFEQMNQQGYVSTCAAVRDMDLTNVARLNTLPTLIIAGQHDIASPLSKSEYLLSQYKNAELIILDAGHLSNIEQEEKFTQAIVEFFNS